MERYKYKKENVDMNLRFCPFPSSMIPYIEQNKQNKVNQNR